MAEVKRIAPEIPVFWDRGPNSDIASDIRIAKQHHFEALVLHHSGVTSDKVRRIRSAGLQAGAWTVNDESTMKRLLAMNVDRLYTDNPRLLLRLKAKQQTRRPAD